MHHLYIYLSSQLLLFNAITPLPFPYVFPTSTVAALIPTGRQLSPVMDDLQIKPLLNLITGVLMAFITCLLTLCGAGIGIVTGTIRGQRIETGFVRGACVGAVTGAIAVLQVMDMMANGEPVSKVALLHSLLNGEVFTDQWTSAMESSFADIFDMENNGRKGLSEDAINKLPKHIFKSSCRVSQKYEKSKETTCVICLEDFENEEEGRELPSCRHVFHVKCIDKWLIRQGCCPICRKDV